MNEQEETDDLIIFMNQVLNNTTINVEDLIGESSTHSEIYGNVVRAWAIALKEEVELESKMRTSKFDLDDQKAQLDDLKIAKRLQAAGMVKGPEGKEKPLSKDDIDTAVKADPEIIAAEINLRAERGADLGMQNDIGLIMVRRKFLEGMKAVFDQRGMMIMALCKAAQVREGEVR